MGCSVLTVTDMGKLAGLRKGKGDTLSLAWSQPRPALQVSAGQAESHHHTVASNTCFLGFNLNPCPQPKPSASAK